MTNEAPPKNPLRAWCFVVYNYTPEHEETIRQLSENSEVLRLAVGREICPKTGTPHLQGYIKFSKSHRFAAVKKLLPAGANIRPRYADKECQASQYCLKDGNILVDKGIDSDSDDVHLSRSAECDLVIDEIEQGQTFGQIRNRHKQFVFWYRRNVIDYIQDTKRLKSQSTDLEQSDQTSESGTHTSPHTHTHTA